MAQHDYDIANQNGASLRQDLNDVLAAIISNNSGPTAPTTTEPYMFWPDTTSGVMKQRNAADTAWVSLYSFGASLLSSTNNLSDVANASTAFTNIKQPASTTVTGVVEKATPTETADGTADKYPDAALIKSTYAPLDSPEFTTGATIDGVPVATTENSGINLGTVVTTTGGVSIDFTSIPATAKRITLTMEGLSTNGTSNVIVQLGDSGGFEVAGYISTSQTGTTAAGATSGFQVTNNYSASDARNGSVVIQKLDTNTWVYSSLVSTGLSISSGAGSKTLSGVLDRVRITTINGTDVFDAVKVNISWE